MTKSQINNWLNNLAKNSSRNIIIVDFANVDHWQNSLGWPVGIRQLGNFVKHFAKGKKYLRRFYYGEDYGKSEKSTALTPWSRKIKDQAIFSGFHLVTKRVKYIPDAKYATGYVKKCNLDVEMAMDLIKEKENYDNAIVFSGDGDLGCVFEYLNKSYQKHFYIFGARDHIGKEILDATKMNHVNQTLFVEDFEYRLNLSRVK